MKVTIRLSSFNMVALEKSYNSLKKACTTNKFITIDDIIFEVQDLKYVRLPKKRSIYTILKSPHIDKKARNQLGIVSYNRLMQLNLRKINDTKSINISHDFTKVVASLKDVSAKVKFKQLNII